MKVTNWDIWLTQQGALKELLDEKWPVKTAYWLAKLGQKLAKANEPIEQVRQKLIREYGTADEKGLISIGRASEKWSEFETSYNELMAEEVEIDVEKVVLPEMDGMTILATLLLNVEPFVEVA